MTRYGLLTVIVLVTIGLATETASAEAEYVNIRADVQHFGRSVFSPGAIVRLGEPADIKTMNEPVNSEGDRLLITAKRKDATSYELRAMFMTLRGDKWVVQAEPTVTVEEGKSTRMAIGDDLGNIEWSFRFKVSAHDGPGECGDLASLGVTTPVERSASDAASTLGSNSCHVPCSVGNQTLWCFGGCCYETTTCKAGCCATEPF